MISAESGDLKKINIFYVKMKEYSKSHRQRYIQLEDEKAGTTTLQWLLKNKTYLEDKHPTFPRDF